MSEFAVTVREITEKLPIPNSDNLEIIRLNGLLYNIITNKSSNHEVGDLMVYFPCDSVLTEDFIKKYDISYLKKKGGKYIVFAVKLRGVISEGLALPLSLFEDLGDIPFEPGFDMTEMLGVTKYEEPELQERRQGNMPGRKRNGISLPPFIKYYDIENVQSHLESWKVLQRQGYKVATEKIEGEHIVVARVGDVYFVTSRRVNREEDSYFWQAAVNNGLLSKIKYIGNPDDTVVIRSELVGPGLRENIYGLDKMTTYTFDIEVNGQFMDFFDMKNVCKAHDILTVPMLRLFEPHMPPEEALEFAHRRSVLNNNVMAEGVVFKPVKEALDDYGERIQLKIRDGEYLAAFAKGDVTWNK